MKIRIENARLFDPQTGRAHVTDLLIAQGKIASIGGGKSPAAERVFNAQEALLVPGFIDLACHLRDGSEGADSSLAIETQAAAKGGFTTLCRIPDSDPLNDTAAVTSLVRGTAQRTSRVRILPIGAVTRGLGGEQLSDMAGLQQAGCVALSNGQQGFASSRVIRRCMAYAQTFGVTLMLQPENKALSGDGCVHEGLLATRLGLPGIPHAAETTAVSELILLAEDAGARLHLSQISCARSLDLIRAAKQRGQCVTADVAITSLVLNESAIGAFDSRFHLRPPLRTEADRCALVAGVSDGTISAISSQHRPLDNAAKKAPFAQAAVGLSTIESVLSLGLLLVERGELSLQQLVSCLTLGPAEVLSLPVPQLVEGAAADLCVFSATQHWRAQADQLLSAGKWVPMADQDLPGRVLLTFCAGALVYAAPEMI